MPSLKVTGATALLLLGGLSTPAWAQKTTCKDVPIRWFIYQTVTAAEAPEGALPARIRGDGGWYAPGGGNNNVVIHTCGTNPSYDATIVVGSKRKVFFDFGAPITGSVIQSSLPTGTYINTPFMNVRNLLCAGCADPAAPFTTRMSIQLYSFLSGQDYRLRFMPPNTDALDRHSDPDIVPAENLPYESSPVRVEPQPYNCNVGGTTMPAWIIRGYVPSADPAIAPSENLQVGTLYNVTRSGDVHKGQFSMPFEIRIEALSCLTR